ncbi:MAG: hypothetical protein ABIS07_06250, partial [Dokdonella sp.]
HLEASQFDHQIVTQKEWVEAHVGGHAAHDFSLPDSCDRYSASGVPSHAGQRTCSSAHCKDRSLRRMIASSLTLPVGI